MGIFEKLIALRPLQPHLEMADEVFVDESGWRSILGQVKQLKQTDVIIKIIEEAQPTCAKEQIILGYLCTMAAEAASGPVELACVEYGGCYLSRGELRFHNRSEGYYPSYLGMGMNASTSETKIFIEGDTGDYLGYRAPRLNIHARGTAGDCVGMAVGEGTLRIEGDVSGGLGGSAQNTRFEVSGSVGHINEDNIACTILIAGDVHRNIEHDQVSCFIKVAGSVGLGNKKEGRLYNIAAGLSKNSVLLIGGDAYGHIGRRMGLAKIVVWGRVKGEVQPSVTAGGFIYLNKKSVPFYQRITKSIGGDISIKYVPLKDSGYLFAEGPEDLEELFTA